MNLDAKDEQVIRFWVNNGYNDARNDARNGIEPTGERIIRLVCFFEFMVYLSLASPDADEDRHRYNRIRPFLARAYVKGYKSYANS